MNDLAHSIEVKLDEIEHESVQWTDRHFIERVQALDVLERQIINRIEEIFYVEGYHQALAVLSRRAALLKRDLDDLNTVLFHQLREQLVAASDTISVLKQHCEIYVGHDSRQHQRITHDEDYFDVFVNGVLGVGAAPEETLASLPEMIGYIPTPARVIFYLADHLSFKVDDVFYDIGSGLGRVPLLIGLLTVAATIGIEIEPVYCAYAQHRTQSLGLSQVTFINCDARVAEYADGTIFFLYTPFTGGLFQVVLDRLRDVSQTRPITIAAYGPCTLQVEQQSWLQPTQRKMFGDDALVVFVTF